LSKACTSERCDVLPVDFLATIGELDSELMLVALSDALSFNVKSMRLSDIRRMRRLAVAGELEYEEVDVDDALRL
jgi:hypothetical protein